MRDRCRSSANLLKNDKGIALVIAMLMVLIVSILAVSMVSISVTEGYLSNNCLDARKAFYAAEAGAQDGVRRLLAGTITDTTPDTTTWNAASTYSSTGFFNSFTVKHLVNATTNTVIKDAGGNPYYIVQSTGWEGNAKRTQKKVELIVSLLRGSVYSAGLIGCNKVKVTGSGLIDSYDSSAGTYASQATNTDAGGHTFARNNSSIVTCNAGADILFTADAPMHGNLSATGTVTPPNTNFYGTATAGIPTSSCDPLDVVNYIAARWPTPVTTTTDLKTDAALTAPNSYHYRNIQLASESITISGSGVINLFIDVDFTMTGSSSRVSVPSGVTLNIYVKRKFDISGQGIINASGDPASVNVYCEYDSGTVATDHLVYTGSGAFYGTVYAPRTNVRMSGSGGTYGSIRGKNVEKTGTADFHYDETLATIGGTGPVTGYAKQLWKDNF
jgi:Tfp pilus assembly protein PilX